MTHQILCSKYFSEIIAIKLVIVYAGESEQSVSLQMAYPALLTLNLALDIFLVSGLETHACKLAKCELKFRFASWKYRHSKKVASSIFHLNTKTSLRSCSQRWISQSTVKAEEKLKHNIMPDNLLFVYGGEIKHISTGLVALAHCIMTTIKSLYIERHKKNDTLDITMEVRKLYRSFIMSKLFSAHDGDMLVIVLNKKDVQKNKRSAF